MVFLIFVATKFTNMRLYTIETGYFKLDGLTPGKYNITVEFIAVGDFIKLK